MKRKLSWDKLSIILSLLVTLFLHNYVNQSRGYVAFGGECLLPVLAILVVILHKEFEEVRALK